MQLDTPPTAASAAEKLWVEAELVRNLMRASRSGQFAGLALIAVLVAVIWNADSAPLLLAWASVAAAALGARVWVLRVYKREVMQRGASEHLAFFQRWRLIWPLGGFMWGASTLLFFDRVSLADQFICWLIIAGLGMFSLNSLASHLGTLRAYLNSLALTALAVMFWRVGVELQFTGPTYHGWLILLLLIFWQLLRQAGLRMHRTQRRNFELQYRNNLLIESLTRQTQAALDAVEVKNRFLASAAHDIRQPVHALSLYADWLGSEPELVHDLAPKIVEATKAVNTLFDSLFDLARLDSGKLKLEVATVDLAQLLHDLEVQYRPLAEAKGLDFRLHVRPGVVQSDPILLKRVVGNLVSNAIKYTERGGVLVAVRHTHRGACIEIWDTGIGIDPVNQKEIFREFYKVQTHQGTEDGFGLGLYIVARLIHILGHPLSLSSRMGRGSVFRLLLTPTQPQIAVQRAAAPNSTF